MLPRLTAEGERAFAPHPGGGALNVARALARLCARAGLVCGLSRDLFGEMLVASLEAAGVDIALCPRVDRPTTLAFVSLSEGEPRYAFHDENSALRMFDRPDLPEPPSDSVLLFGGISLSREPCGAAYEAMAARAGGRIVALDPNIRPALAADEPALRARLTRMIARADILKLSQDDLRWITQGAPEPDALAALRAAGPSLVVLTKGAEGAEAHFPGGSLSMEARPASVADTVGAGDAFLAGLLAGLASGGALDRERLRVLGEAALRPALDLALRAGAFAVSRAGAAAPTMADLGA